MSSVLGVQDSTIAFEVDMICYRMHRRLELEKDKESQGMYKNQLKSINDIIKRSGKGV